MPDRLAGLHRQRILIADHLAWLDQEIAAAAPTAAAASGQKPPGGESVSVQPSDFPVAAPPKDTPHAVMLGGTLVSIRPEQAILPDHDPVHIKDNVRRGCFLYVALAALLVALGGALLIWAARSPWFQKEVSPYLTKVFFVALVFAFGAGIRGLIAQIRSK